MADREPPIGAVLVDKPAGITSHDVVARARRELGIRRIGHAGTLDPFATGLLIVLVGRATRLQRYLLGLPKTYVATAKLGWRSSTGDPDGELTETGSIPSDPRLPIGRITQKLPLTSAVKVDGERLYKKAHRGEEFDTPEREVEVHRAERIAHVPGESAEFEIECSSGTYIRTLIETIDDAYCADLRRTAIGSIGIGRAVDLDRIGDSGALLDPGDVLTFMPERALTEAEAAKIANGVPVARDPGAGEGPVRLTHGARLLAVGAADGELWRPEVVLA